MNAKAAPHTSRLLSPQQVAEILGVSPRWVYRRALEGELPFAHLGDNPRSPLRADARAIDAWINRRLSLPGRPVEQAMS